MRKIKEKVYPFRILVFLAGIAVIGSGLIAFAKTPEPTTTEEPAAELIRSTPEITPAGAGLLKNLIDGINSVLTPESSPNPEPSSALDLSPKPTPTKNPAVKITEQDTDTGKLVTVSAPNENLKHPLVDVLASSKIPEIYKVGEEHKIKIKWSNNGDKEVGFRAFDKNGNGKLDYVEWSVPHLSTQTFEIIFISKAFQLDESQAIISDIYDTVKTKNGGWATIQNNQYVRYTFSQTLNKTKDNTIYAKPSDPDKPVTIEVYPVYTDADGNQTEGPLVAKFPIVNRENTYKILLTNLKTPTDVFDSKITGGDVDIDYIVDPNLSINYLYPSASGFKTGAQITVYAGISDEPDEYNVDFYCNESGSPDSMNNLCSQTNIPYPYSNVSCSYNAPMNMDGSRTIYCNIRDSGQTSSDSTTSYYLDNYAPSYNNATTASAFSIYNYFIRGTGEIDGGTATDYGSGINGMSCEYTLDGWSWNYASFNGTYCYQPFVSVTNGTSYTFNTRVSDYAGNQATGMSTSTYTGDDAAPTTTDSSDTSWHTSDQTIYLYPSDNMGSGVAYTYYCVDTSGTCTPMSTYSSSVWVNCSLGQACQQYVRYYSIDYLGNTESIKTSNSVNIDGQNPSIGQTTFSGFTTYGNYIGGTGTIIGGSANDGPSGSGVNTSTCQYTPDNGFNWYSASWNSDHCEQTNFSISNGTTYTFNTRVSDYAGNQGTGSPTPTPSPLTGDTDPPTTTDSSDSSWHIDDQTIYLYPNDSGSGVASTTYCTNTSGDCIPGYSYMGSVSLSCLSGNVCQQYVRYYSADNLGNNESAKNSNLVKIDKENPSMGQTTLSGFTTANISGTWYISGSGTAVGANPSDGSGSGIDSNTCEYTTDNGYSWFTGAWDTNHCKADITIGNGSTYTFNLRVKDSAGNSGAGTATIMYTGDTLSPTQSNWNPGYNATISNPTQTIDFNLNEPGDCKIGLTDNSYDSMSADCTGDGTTNISCITPDLGSNGTKYVYISCRDTLNNKDSDSTNSTLVYDLESSPSPTPTPGLPPTQSNWNPASGSTIITATPTIAVSLSANGDCKSSTTDQSYDAMSTDCTGDGTTSISCTTSNLGSDGAKNVYIACQDMSGNKDTADTNTGLTYTLDTAKPTQSDWSPASGTSIITATPTIILNLNENGDCKSSTTDQTYDAMSTDCTGDGTTSISCTTSNLGSDGAKNIYIACKDTAGNKDTAGTNTALNYTLDTVAPLIYTPGTVIYQQGTNGYSGTTNGAITSYGSYADYNRGDMIEAGHSSYGNTRGFVRFDLSALTGVVSVTSATLSLYLDNVYAGTLPQGYSTARVKRTWGGASGNWATAAAGELSQTSAQHGSVAWATAGCNNTTSDRTAAADSASISSATGFHDWTVTTWVTDWLVSGVPNYGLVVIQDNEGIDGDIQFRSIEAASAADRPKLTINYIAGIVSPASGSTITTATPTITLTLNENGDCKSSTTDQSYDAMSTDCTGDGTTSISCTTSNLGSDGAKNVYIACRDTAGNKDTAGTNTDLAYTLDSTPPSITAITSVAGDASAPYYDTTDNSSTLVVYTASSDATTCKWNTTDVAYDSMSNTCSSTTNCTLNLSGAGAKTVYMRCADAASNKATSSYTLNYTIDASAPSVSITSPATGNHVNASKVITFTDNETTNPQCSVDNSNWTNCTSNTTTLGDISQFAGLTEAATFTLYLKDTDAAGNTGTNNVANIIKDTISPTQSSWNPANSSTITSATPTITLTLNENGDCYAAPTDETYDAMVGDAGATNCTGDGTTSISCAMASLGTSGTKNIHISCKDTAGNKDIASTNTDLTYTLALVFNDAADGNWNSGATWGNTGNDVEGSGYPGASDPATIDSNTVTLTTNQSVASITISGGTLAQVAKNLSVSGAVSITGGSVTRTSGTFAGGTLTADGTTITLSGNTFPGAVNVTYPSVLLNGSTYNGATAIEKTGAGNSFSTGSNTFNSTATIVNSGSGDHFLGFGSADTFNGDATFTITGTGNIRVADVGGTNVFNGNIIVNSTSGYTIFFGGEGGLSTLASNKTISVGGSGFSNGGLSLRGVNYTNTSPFSLALTGTASLILGSGTTFAGNVNFTAPGIELAGATYNGTATIEKTGAGNNYDTGVTGNTFNSTTTITNSGSGQLLLEYGGVTDAFNSNVTFVNNSSGGFYVAYFNTNTFAGNVTATGGISFGGGGGTMNFTKATGTQILTTNGSTIPKLAHTGAGILQLGSNLTSTTSFDNTSGTLDTNGYTFSAAAFSVGPGSTTKLSSTKTYTVSGNFTSTATSGSHAVVNASTPSSRAIFTVSGTAVVNYVDGTDIDSSSGTLVNNITGGTSTNCLNWYTVPTLTSVSASPTTIKGGNTLTITPTGQGGTGTLHFYCNETGSPTSADTLCSQADASYTTPFSTMTCTYAPTGNATRTVYCRVYDGTNYTADKTTSYTVDSTNPTVTITSPANGANLNNTSVSFSASASDTNTGFIVPNLDSSLVSWWRMDDVDGSGNPTDYIGSNNGTKYGNATQTANGKFGKAFSFDGNGDYVQTPDILLPTTGITWSAWAYMSTQKEYHTIIQQGSSYGVGNINIGLYQNGVSNVPYFQIGADSATAYDPSFSVSINNWHHYVGVQNGSTTSLYVDGALIDTTSGSYSTQNTYILIGKNRAAGTNQNFNGSIDDVMIFNRALTTDEITALYNGTAISHSSTLSEASHTYKVYSQDLAGNVGSSGPNTFTVDATAPSGGSIIYTSGYYTVASVPITYSTGTDTNSGLNNSTGKIQRASATLSAGSCGSYSSFADLVTEYDGSHTDTTVVTGNCYKYQYLIQDVATNQATYTSANVAKVDTGAPTVDAGADQTKNAQFTQTATASDSVSGINASTYQWAKVSGPGAITFGSATALGTTILASTDGDYVISFTVSDNAGNSASDNFNLSWGTTPPTQSNWNPASGSTIDSATPTITLTLNKAGDCRASTSDKSYDDMSGDVDCTGDNSTSTTCAMSNLGSDGAKNVYIACEDTIGNKDTILTNTNLTYTLAMPVAATTTPTNNYPIGGGGSSWNPTPTPTPSIIEQIAAIPESIINLFQPVPAPISTPLPSLPPISQVVLPLAPQALAGVWNLLPEESINSFVLAPLPQEIRDLAAKFPQLGQTLQDVGVTKITDLEKLMTTNLTLPGLTQLLGLPTNQVQPGQLALPRGVPLAQLTPEVKEQLPSEVVFAKTGSELIDFNPMLSVNNQGLPEQTITTIAGKLLQLAVKPDQPVRQVLGYMVFKSKYQAENTTPDSNQLTISLSKLLGSVISALPKLAQVQTQPVEQRLVLAQFEYTDPDHDGIYTASVQAPSVEGSYDIVTVFNYQDLKIPNKEMHLITVVDPEGYVYEKNGSKETRIPDATVSLFWLDPQTKQYILWPAKDYQQDNPQITNITGKYSFLVPEGTYYLKAEAKEYSVYEGQPFSVSEGAGIHTNIELKGQYWFLQWFDWKTIILVIVVLLLLYNFYSDKILKRKLKV